MLKISLIAAALMVASATKAQDWRAQDNGHGHGAYGYDSNTSALGRDCPAGYYPHSAPNGNGVRCEPPGDTTEYISPR
jgi:hypothetical protein